MITQPDSTLTLTFANLKLVSIILRYIARVEIKTRLTILDVNVK